MAADGEVTLALSLEDTSDESFHGRLLLSDIRLAHAIFGELRYRTVARLFGVSREDSAIVALIGTAMALGAVREKLATLRPHAGDAALTASGMNVLVHRIAGPTSQNVPAFGALVALALIGHGAKPMIRASLHAAETASHDVHVMFDHRYGHLIRPIHHHATRLRRRSQGVPTS